MKKRCSWAIHWILAGDCRSHFVSPLGSQSTCTIPAAFPRTSISSKSTLTAPKHDGIEVAYFMMVDGACQTASIVADPSTIGLSWTPVEAGILQGVALFLLTMHVALECNSWSLVTKVVWATRIPSAIAHFLHNMKIISATNELKV